MRRKLGQHFLADKRVVARILQTAQITSQDCVVEIGPGHGTLTFLLARHAKELIAIEYDPALVSRLQQAFADQPHVRIIRGDARHLEYGSLLSDWGAQQRRCKVVANLPYYAAVPILLTILRNAALFQECTFMFQQEVAERITAAPGSKAYGILSITVQYYAKPRLCFSIAPQAFRPRPEVDSAVVKLSIYETPRLTLLDQEAFFHLVRCAFQSRRKTLKNSLVKSCADHFSGDLLQAAYKILDFPENIRGEELSLEHFANLSNVLVRMQRDFVQDREGEG